MSYLVDPKVQLAVLVVLLAAVVVSLLYEPANMLQNLIAEAAGIALGVWLTITLVERMLERERHRRWQEVRSQVFRAISSHIIDIALYYTSYSPSVMLEYSATLLDGRARATPKAENAMIDILEAMRKKRPVDSVGELFRETEWHFGHFRDVFTSRLIEFGEEPELIRLLMDLDDRRAAWKNAVIDVLETELDKEAELIVLSSIVALDSAFDAAMDTLEALITLYRYLEAS